jgi:catechol 2,3-dioxygenase-like lactoylglutathione lyase family enzyme
MALAPLSVVHVNVNCSDLERSLSFYRDRVGLQPVSHTNPPPQSGAGFGIDGEVQWDAHLLHDDRGVAGPALDLLEWKHPSPIGRPPQDANHLGYFRLCLTHPDLPALHAELGAEGVACRSAPVAIPVLGDALVRFFCCADPDGTTIEFIERPGRTRLLHVNLNCRDLDVSSAWYRDVMGLVPIAPRAEPGPTPGAAFGYPDPCEYRADFLVVPGGGDEPFILDLLQWQEPKPCGRPLAEANHLGMFRMAFLVEDAAAACAELDRLGVEHSGPCWLDMGPEIPIDGLHAVFFRDPDGTCVELIERPEMPGG